ncbi:WD40-like Beta Propeller Repeat [Spirosomataceae bacterium TFI 002]|nr:WD40-like Beta Propeller Repeat [Spirosomataceae bacterium TFI 002]
MNKFTVLASILIFGISESLAQDKKRLPEPINTSKSIEYAPSITADGQTLVYQSDQYGIYVNAGKKVPQINADGKSEVILDEFETTFFGVYEAKLHPSGEWMRPTNIAPINEYANGNMSPVMGGPSISYDGNMLFFFANFGKSGYGREDIYYSEREKNGWTKPENIGSKINTDSYEGFPSISPDGKKLYFTQEIFGKKVEGKQCYRIMVSEKNRLGNWRSPYELPSPINKDCEKAPRILADGKTLVFSSIKKEGRGDFDLYKSVLQEDGSWSQPENLEFINSKKSDLFVSVSPCGDLMYYVSNGDIYSTTIPESLRPIRSATIQGFVIDSVTKKPIEAKVIVKEKSTGITMAVLDNNKSDGRFTAIVPFGGDYDISVNLPDYFTKSVAIKQDILIDCKPIPLDLLLTKIPTDASEIARIAQNDPSKTQVSLQKKDENKDLSNPISINENTLVTEEKPSEKVSKSMESPTPQKAIEEMELVADSPETTSEKISAEGEKLKGSQVITRYALILKVVDKESGEFIPNPNFILTSGNGGNTSLKPEQNGNEFILKAEKDDQFKITVDAPGFLPFSANIPAMTSDRKVTLKLAPLLPSLLSIVMLDAETDKELNGLVKIYSQKSNNTTTKEIKDGLLEYKLTQNDELLITGSSPGYLNLDKKVMVDIPENGNKNIDLELKLARNDFELNLVASDLESGNGIANAVFYVYDAEEKRVLELISDSKGNAKGKLNKNGKYKIELLADGFKKSEQTVDNLLQSTSIIFKSVKDKIPTHEVKVLVFDKYTEEEIYPEALKNGDKVGKAPFFIQGIEGDKVKIEWADDLYKPEIHNIDFDKALINRVSTNLIAERKSYPFYFRFIDKQTKKTITRLDFKVVDLATKQEVQKQQGGEFIAALEPSKSYALSIQGDGYETVESKVVALEWLKSLEFERDIYLIAESKTVSKLSSDAGDFKAGDVIQSEAFGEIKKGKKITLENIYFDQSSPVLREESFEQLDELVKILKENNSVKIEVRGHTDNEGDFYLNVKLSKERCESVIKYLTSKGIHENRLTAVGRGPIEPISSNENEESRKKNRRVEFMVL